MNMKKTVKEKVEIGRQLAPMKSWLKLWVKKADISALKSHLKAMKNIDKSKEKELHDINKNKILRENFETSNRDLKMSTEYGKYPRKVFMGISVEPFKIQWICII